LINIRYELTKKAYLTSNHVILAPPVIIAIRNSLIFNDFLLALFLQINFTGQERNFKGGDTEEDRDKS
jgi:hypothetical protein